MAEAITDFTPAQLQDIVDRVAGANERVVLTREGRQVAAVVPIEDLEALRAMESREDAADNEACDRAEETFRAGETIPWAEAKRRLSV